MNAAILSTVEGVGVSFQNILPPAGDGMGGLS